MGVWDFKMLSDNIKKWQKLLDTPGITERDRAFYQREVDSAKAVYALYAGEWEENIRIRKEGVSLGNVANRQCPMCHANDIQQIWVVSNSYFQCNKCGERFKDE
jgi:ribosomal protein L37AE/L43A